MSKTEEQIIHLLPKIELHVHLEGALSPVLLEQFAREQQKPIRSDLIRSNRQYAFSNFTEFLKVYDEVSSYITSTAQLETLTYHFLEQSHAEGVIYTELTVSPDHMLPAGISFDETITAVTRGIKQAHKDFGIEARIIVVLVRHLGVEACSALLDKVIKSSHDTIVGIGLAGDEENFPAGLFADLFKRAKDAGLGLTAHAGEWCGPEKIRDTINELGVSRIGHGVRSIESDDLISSLKQNNIHLEVCPLSNLCLQVYPDYSSHPLKKLFESKVSLSLNSDDPPFFATTVGNEYLQAYKQAPLQINDLLQITDNAIAASFADNSLKSKLKKIVDEKIKLMSL